MNTELFNQLHTRLVEWGVAEPYAQFLDSTARLILVVILALLSDIIFRKVLIRLISRVADKTATTWDDILVEKKVFNRLSHLAPALVLYYTTPFVFDVLPAVVPFLQAAIRIYMIIMVLLVVDSFINALGEIYLTLPISKNRPITGYIQVAKIIVYFVAVILILSILLGKSPSRLLTGLGALAAVLMLVFKDTILGFVASIQLSANKMVQIGDWISMPSHGADGTVEAITLNTVKVQNWDKTISTIPTYAMVSESFNNWRGMEESGGRRIKRHINIDMKSVGFLSPDQIEKLRKIHFLKDYMDTRLNEIQKFNEELGIDDSTQVNGRRMTNLGTFRKYLEAYLKQHGKIHNDMTFLVRQLQPSEKGIPMEIYVFSNDQAWANYESIQADIFDHVLAVIPEFGLRVFQNPTGEDFHSLLNVK